MNLYEINAELEAAFERAVDQERCTAEVYQDGVKFGQDRHN